jgi:hypothetical protein
MTVAHATDDSAFLRPGGDVRQSKKRKWDAQISAPLVLWLRRCCEVNEPHARYRGGVGDTPIPWEVGMRARGSNPPLVTPSAS